MTPSQPQMTKVPLLDLQAQFETIRDDVRAAVDRVFDSQQFVLGAEVQALEEEIARYTQTKFAIGCASGSDALLLALMSCQVGVGDEIITTPFSFFATAGAITRLGARPVFVDIDERTFNLNPSLVDAALTERTRAIVSVHLYGQCAEMDTLIELSQPRAFRSSKPPRRQSGRKIAAGVSARWGRLAVSVSTRQRIWAARAMAGCW